jgi:hypothetical protein
MRIAGGVEGKDFGIPHLKSRQEVWSCGALNHSGDLPSGREKNAKEAFILGISATQLIPILVLPKTCTVHLKPKMQG